MNEIDLFQKLLPIYSYLFIIFITFSFIIINDKNTDDNTKIQLINIFGFLLLFQFYQITTTQQSILNSKINEIKIS